MIGRNVKQFCCEDISLIENYNKAISDNTQIYECHHRNEIILNKYTEELIADDLYYNRPASELIFLTRQEHRKIHAGFKPHCRDGKAKEIFDKKINTNTRNIRSKTKTYNKDYTYWSKEEIMLSYLKFKNVT